MKKKVILFGVMVFFLFCTGCTGVKSEPEEAVVETTQEVVQDDVQKENIQQKAESTDVSFTEEELNFYRDVSINPGSRFKCCNGFCFVHERD